MTRRKLGRSNLSIAPIVFGGNVFGWSADEKTSFSLLDAFVDAGFNAIDTADVYSHWVPGNKGGESETIIGRWLKARGRRDDVLIFTKAGGDMGSGASLKGDYVIRAAEASLRRLQTDTIDLYQTHFDDLTTAPDETLRAYATLVEQGKVRVLGASNVSPERLRESLAASKTLGIPRYETLQPLYNLYDRAGFERDYQALCEQEQLGVIPYYALARGFLSGKYRSKQDLSKSAARGAANEKYLDARGLRILDALDAVAARHAAKPAQIALAWLLAQPTMAAPIVSATSLPQLAELLKAPEIKLTADDVAALNDASAEASPPPPA
ncbi:aldo/keto reductase [Pseudorhodoplanes sp.]|uniref:aldo/keto reductase n=1 Tax=Pseudorhodoplanes sp. TaxID=1934341 RepID=UPI002D027F54|nr:aldo/keto reductase [Pseudorhodoplanes sp.]HWV53381.1 aldo/keto reductase [Pseudorhodoplanes sp.]